MTSLKEKVITALAVLGVGFTILTYSENSRLKKEIKQLSSDPYKTSYDFNNDGRDDYLFLKEFSGNRFISLPNGKFERVQEKSYGYVSLDGKKVYTKEGLMIDRENNRLVDMVTGKGVELK